MYYLTLPAPDPGIGTSIFFSMGLIILLTIAAAIAGIVFLIIWLTKKR